MENQITSPKKIVRFFRITLPMIFTDTASQFKKAQIFMVAGSLAYTTILSIIPVLAVSFAIFKAFGGLNKLSTLIEPLILSNLAHGASEDAMAALRKFIENTNAGAIGASGLVGLIATSMSMLSSAEKAINHVWQTQVQRGLFQRIASYWLFITLGPLGLSIAVGLATSSSLPLTKFFPSGTGMFALTVALFFGVYQWVPHTPVKWKYALTSAVFTSMLWNLARWGYTLYTKAVVTYNTIYGSMGAVPLLLLWIFIMWVIVLGGAAFTAALQKKTTDLS